LSTAHRQIPQPQHAATRPPKERGLRCIGRSGSSRAQSAVEFALILPLFVLALTGIFDVTRMLTIHSAVVSASREGARYGAAVGDNGSGTLRYVDCAGIRAAVRNASSTLVTLTDTQIRISHDNGAGVARSQPCAPHGTGPVVADIQNLDRVLVEVTVQYEPITPLVSQVIGPVTVVSVDRRTIVMELP
jgi:Flp pilus assembly protein TadG